MKPYDVVTELENQVADYCGSRFAVAVDSCTNAITLCLDYLDVFGKTVSLPKYTYVGVAHAVLNSGGTCCFRDEEWVGYYDLKIEDEPIRLIDSARWFSRDIHVPNSLMCLSAHWGKTLKIGRGGFILSDDVYAVEDLKRMRFDGRKAGVSPKGDRFDIRGRHCYMLPEEASRGLMLMASMPDKNEPLPEDGYVDLSKYSIFRGE